MKKVKLLFAVCLLTSGCWLMEPIDGPQSIGSDGLRSAKTHGEQLGEGVTATGRAVGGPIGFGIILGGLALTKLFREMRKKKKK